MPSSDRPRTAHLPRLTAGTVVLVADDNADCANSLAWCLDGDGYRTLVAYDGIQAVEAALADRPSVAILDLGMPRLDGYGAARAIRAALGDRVLLIAHTAWGDDAARQSSNDAGFDHHVLKSEGLETLLALLSPSRNTNTSTQ